MSSFIVETSTINKILFTLSKHKPNSEYDLFDAEYMAELGCMMAAMNAAASKEDPSSIRPGPFKHEPCSLMQGYKSLRCFLYQCDEKKTYEWLLYKELDAYSKELAVHIVQESPEYEKASWG